VRVLGEQAGSGSFRELERVAEPLTRLGAAVAAPERGTEVGERVGILEPGR
jgi:hypothetical protein